MVSVLVNRSVDSDRNISAIIGWIAKKLFVDLLTSCVALPFLTVESQCHMDFCEIVNHMWFPEDDAGFFYLVPLAAQNLLHPVKLLSNYKMAMAQHFGQIFVVPR